MKYLKQITVEPVFFLVFVNFGLIVVSNQDLYLKKACLVNLNYTEEVCDNLQNQTDIQTEVQKYVSQIQAYNGFLQSAPGVILALFAGPLTDTLGRKPLMIASLVGYFLCNIVFLINSYWFYELKVSVKYS